jgi:glycine betaine/proline transport system ATP-binding protein
MSTLDKDVNASDILLQVKGLYKLFGDKPSAHMDLVYKGLSKAEILEKTGHTLGLKDINLDIKQGEIYVIMGLSGSGKSTLIRHFNRLIEPSAGQIIFKDEDVLQFDKARLQDFRRHKMSMVFQHFGLMPHHTVIENVAFGLKTQGLAKKERLERAKVWLKDVGLEGYDDLYPAQLSGGQQQRVGLARALCTDSDVLLMDEAFSALDPLIRSEMQDQLIELQQKLHKTIVFITHDLDEALRIGDRIAILKDGVLVQVGEPKEILLEPVDDYVEAFVRDVNRARALTVENVMKAPLNRITVATIGEAIEQMKASPQNYGYVVSDEGYEGTVLQETLEEAVSGDANKGDPLTDAYFEDSPEVSPDSLLEEVIPETLDTDLPLAVVNEDGKLTGVLSRSRLAKILGR